MASIGIATAAPPIIEGCRLYPPNNAWNVRVDTLPVHPNSDAYITHMQGATRKLHADWGNNPSDYYGIPFAVVSGSQTKTTVVFGDEAAEESDPGPYPLPLPNPPIEGAPGADGDRHVLMLDKDNCILYELFYVWPPNTPGYNETPNWTAYSGAIFDLKRNDMRTDGWTSADAAGLAILPGLVRYEDVAAGEIEHAIRMTASGTQNTYVWPASHHAGVSGTTRPPMGQRFRLKASYVIPATFSIESQRILRALKKYGAIIADNGSNFFISGTTSTQWPDAMFGPSGEISSVPGTAFEAVQGHLLQVAPNSYAARGAAKQEDYNADTKPDLFWRHAGNGNTYVWYMNGPVLQSDAFLAGIDPMWKLEGSADFNGDGQVDLVWRDTTSGATWVWHMNGTTLASDAFLFSLPPVWKVEGIADFNLDGRPDFLMRNTSSGLGFLWYFNDSVAIGDQYLFTIDPSWKVEAVGDVSLDGQPDLLFRNSSSGLAFAWNTTHAAGTTSLGSSSAPIFSIDPAWEVVQLADWNADGKPDLLFRNTGSGVVFVWYMDGTTLTASDFIVQIDPPWEIVPRR